MAREGIAAAPARWLSDLRTLWHLAFSPIRGESHAERLEGFYRGQASSYDRFRERLLAGRAELWQSISAPDGGTWVDLGGGTGANVECLGDRLAQLEKLWIVDLSTSMLAEASQRVRARGWQNVEVCQADACTFSPPDGQVDVVTFSYSLTMIPDWMAAVDQARSLLRPGGMIGVVDFYVSRKYPPNGWTRHGGWTRTFWPTWFAMDNVFLNPDQAAYLHRAFEPVDFRERRAKVPYLLGAQAPYYLFLGRKPQ